MAYKKSKLKGKAKGNLDRYDHENNVGTSNDLGGYGGGYNYENKANNAFLKNQAKDVQSYPGRYNNNNSYGNYGNELSRSYGNDLGRSYDKNAFDYGGKSNLNRDAGNYMGGGYNPYGGY